MSKKQRLWPWIKFIVGLAGLSMFFGFFASGYSFPGIFGEVLRHNQKYAIDASPLFYTEVDNMSVLEDGLEDLLFPD